MRRTVPPGRTIAGFLVAGALSFLGEAILAIPALFIAFSAWEW
jgi:hypothetical protein